MQNRVSAGTLAGTIAGIPALPAHTTDRGEDQRRGSRAGRRTGTARPLSRRDKPLRTADGSRRPAADRQPIAPRGAARDLIGMADHVPATN